MRPNFRALRVRARASTIWFLHSGLQLQESNAETLVLEHVRYPELAEIAQTRGECTHAHLSRTHADRVPRHHLSAIPLIRGGKNRDGGEAEGESGNSISRRAFSRAKRLSLTYSRYFTLRLSIAGPPRNYTGFDP